MMIQGHEVFILNKFDLTFCSISNDRSLFDINCVEYQKKSKAIYIINTIFAIQRKN